MSTCSRLFLDLTEAYSVLNHNILFDKLDPYGIRGNMKLWFKSHLLSVTVCCNDPTGTQKFYTVQSIHSHLGKWYVEYQKAQF